MTEPLWRPSPERLENANLTRFMAGIRARRGRDVADYGALRRWALAEPERFWSALWDFAGIVGDGPGECVLLDRERMPGARWFPDAQLNYAENLLRRRDGADALVFLGRGSGAKADELRRTPRPGFAHGPGAHRARRPPGRPGRRLPAEHARDHRGGAGDGQPRCGLVLLLARFRRARRPRPASARSRPRRWSPPTAISTAARRSTACPCCARSWTGCPASSTPSSCPIWRTARRLDGIRGGARYDDALAEQPGGPIAFARLPFDHPLLILFSSGTTGAPKCIVHGAGGTLLQHVKEHLLHSDIKRDDRVFYFTTCGWMMWNWLVTALASEATLLLYDGAPFHPDGAVLFDYAAAEGMTLFGASAKYLDAAAKAGLAPKRTHDLGALRTLASTGSPLAPEGFDYVYDAIKADIHLASISGGTDIVSCFALGDPTGPVWRGELQARGLGMAVEVFDDSGKPLRGAPGELVCTAPFPSMPVGFWSDPDGRKYRDAYFGRFPGVWRHGDWVTLTEHDGLIVHGRSDAVLNPGGVRIGTAEIYRQVERCDAVLEALCVGQDWRGDQRIVLFVRLRDGLVLGDALIDEIKARVRRECTPRHVPAKVIQVADIPRTRSGKITELAVRDVIHGRPVKNREALANPDALALYENLPALRA